MKNTDTKPLWDFAVSVYRSEGVSPACIVLQDRHGADVNMLLFAAWAGGEHRQHLAMAQIEAIDQTISEWRAQIVRPLRAIRRQLKTGPWPAPAGSSDAFRDKIKAVEIQAERLQLDAMAGLLPPPLGHVRNHSDPILANLRAAFTHYASADADEQALALLNPIRDAAARLAASSA